MGLSPPPRPSSVRPCRDIMVGVVKRARQWDGCVMRTRWERYRNFRWFFVPTVSKRRLDEQDERAKKILQTKTIYVLIQLIIFYIYCVTKCDERMDFLFVWSTSVRRFTAYHRRGIQVFQLSSSSSFTHTQLFVLFILSTHNFVFFFASIVVDTILFFFCSRLTATQSTRIFRLV